MAIATGTAILGAGLLAAGGSVASGMMASDAAEDATSAQMTAEQQKIAYLSAQEARDREALDKARALGLQELNAGYGDAATSITAARDRIVNMAPRVREQFGQAEERFDPYSKAGRWGLEQYQNLLRNPSVIKDTPGYQFRLDQGLEAMERSAAARGMLMSGATGESLQRYGQDYASLEFDKSLNRMSNLAQFGQAADTNLANIDINQAGFEERLGGTMKDIDLKSAGLLSNLGINRANIQTGSAAQATQLGSQYATQIGQGMSNLGYIQGSGEINQANTQTSMLNNLASLGMQAYMGYNLSQPQAPQATNTSTTTSGFYGRPLELGGYVPSQG